MLRKSLQPVLMAISTEISKILWFGLFTRLFMYVLIDGIRIKVGSRASTTSTLPTELRLNP